LNGLVSIVTIAAIALPPWLDFAGVHMRLPTVDLRMSAAFLGSASASGICLVFFVGDGSCAWRFFAPNLWLLVASGVFVFAWIRGEGGGLMGAIASVR